MKEATKDDVILILGKGSEDYQLIKGQKIPYEGDIKVVNKIMEDTYGKN